MSGLLIDVAVSVKVTLKKFGAFGIRDTSIPILAIESFCILTTSEVIILPSKYCDSSLDASVPNLITNLPSFPVFNKSIVTLFVIPGFEIIYPGLLLPIKKLLH